MVTLSTAPALGMPPGYMGQQNAEGGTFLNPRDRPRGYTPQYQRQADRDEGSKERHHGDRRDSLNSNGSHSKIATTARLGPPTLHGALSLWSGLPPPQQRGLFPNREPRLGPHNSSK